MSGVDQVVPCPECEEGLALWEVLDAAATCWPYKRWARFECPRCGEQAYFLAGYDALTVGKVDETADAEFVPVTHLTIDDYSSSWSSSGLRITVGDRRWTVKAADDLW